jgi:hypothetical protein
MKENWIVEAETAISGLFGASLTLTRHGANGQAVGICPICLQRTGDGGEDRFVTFREGNYWCRRCENKGWWDVTRKPTREEIEGQKEKKSEELKTLYQMMHQCKDWCHYNKEVIRELWGEQGLTPADIDKWGLGYCNHYPSMLESIGPTLTIPVFFGGELWDIRHRVLNPASGATRYRSHLPGLVPIWFNLDRAKPSPTVFVVEGEKKAMIMDRSGFPTIGYPGVNQLKFAPALITREFKPNQEIVFVPDPGTECQVIGVAQELKKRGFRVSLVDPLTKPDDFILEYGVVCMQDAIKMRRWL